MLLTISTTHNPATDLGFLLHKHPDRVNEKALAFGRAVVLFPEANEDRCHAALLLQIDPIALVRGQSRRRQHDGGLLDQYVNDRPYTASSFMSVAIARLFGTAMAGRCEHRSGLADTAIPLVAEIIPLPCRAEPALLHRLFEPLGYTVEAEGGMLDVAFPEWGSSPFYRLRLRRTCRLAELLTHLYVLIPVLDDSKHYAVGRDEIEKLLTKGEGWLREHPERELTTWRYLNRRSRLTRLALARLIADDDQPDDVDRTQRRASEVEEQLERPIRLHELRLDTVVEELLHAGARRVLDLGCGEGKLLSRLLGRRDFEEIVGLDVSIRALEVARKRLKLDELSPRQRARLRLLHGALTYRDARLQGFDAAALVEVVEHLDPARLRALERVVFEHARPMTVIVTTPNFDYNAKFPSLPAGRFRHPDHRFEWTRAEFAEWAGGIAERQSYTVRFAPVGEVDPELGAPTHGYLPAMRLSIPEFSLVVLIGASGSGKSSFAARHFLPTEVISSDACRALVSNDAKDQSVSADAFDVLRYIAGKRLVRRRLTVIDATNVRAEDRRDLIHLAREYHALPVAIVVDMPESLCQERNRARADRDFGRHVVRSHIQALRRSLRGLKREGFAQWHVLTSPEEVDAVEIERTRLWTDRRDLQGPFDIIGDVHGCFDELQRLLARLGYKITRVDGTYSVRHPEERIVVFVGDLVDRGPAVAEVLRLAMDMVDAGVALCVQGNHEAKLARKLAGREVQIKHGLDKTLAALDGQDEAFRERVRKFIGRLLSHYWLDDGRLVVAHAGLPESMHGRGSPAVRAFALYGETTGEVDEFGLPVRHNWAAHYRGRARVVYGHTPTPEAEWLNDTICIDTGCVFGGKLTALRYPELQLVSEPAVQVYDEPIRPLAVAGSPGLSAQHAHDDLLDLEDVLGRRRIETELAGAITIREENAAAALEVMARFAIDPRWLIYLPPTMSPSETSSQPDLLEHPAEAFAHYRRRAIPRVICQQKHMGSRAVVVVCRDEASARRRFGVLDGETGAIYTRTGRPFFSSDRSLEAAVLARLRDILGAAGAWQRFDTNWFCLDCELLPWSAKAGALLRQQYAPVAASARLGLSAALDALARAHARGIEVAELLQRTNERAETIEAYAAAYRRYCWPVESVHDLKLAPFHILATEGSAHVDKSHSWHMEEIARLSEAGECWLQSTEHCVVDLEDATSVAAAVDWWTALTAQGEEGMVVKPEAFISYGRRGLTQPALKVRGHEYLRIIYGPEYTLPDHLEQLRARGLSRKRSLALQEFALGVEALRRFVSRAPLRKVHECVFGVLALESEPVDPRL